jgi:hypothetical protein
MTSKVARTMGHTHSYRDTDNAFNKLEVDKMRGRSATNWQTKQQRELLDAALAHLSKLALTRAAQRGVPAEQIVREELYKAGRRRTIDNMSAEQLRTQATGLPQPQRPATPPPLGHPPDTDAGVAPAAAALPDPDAPGIEPAQHDPALALAAIRQMVARAHKTLL